MSYISINKCLPSRAPDTHLEDDDAPGEGDDGREDDQLEISEAMGCHDDDSKMQ